MENAKASSTNVALKWALINIVTGIILTYAYKFLGVDINSPLKYLTYIPFIIFLLLAQKEYKDQKNGFMTYGEGFVAGLLFGVFAGIFSAIFIYIYLGILSPEVLEQSVASQREKFVEQGLSSDQIDSAMEITKKYGAIIAAVATLFIIPIFGIIVSLIGAAIFKKERSIFDIEQNTPPFNDPAV